VPHRTAFIAVDLQNCFVADSPVAVPDGPAVLARVNRLAAACREAGVLVVHTAFVLEPGGADLGVLAWTSPPARAGLLDRGSASAALHPALQVDPERDVLIEKPRFGAFYRTGLHGLLLQRGVDTLIVGGLLTNICCETTAREAAVRDFAVYFLSDGTATTDMGGSTAAELQTATLATLGFLFARIVTVEEMVAAVTQGAAA
jgi:nicotinamidase-related amidase